MKKIAVIGATGFATKRMLPELVNSNVAKVVAIQGRDEEKLKIVSNKVSIDRKNLFTNVPALLGADTYDAIYIANPPHLHLETLKLLRNSNAALLCEKPLAQNLEEAHKISELFTDYEQPFMIGHHIRHQKAIIDLKSILEKKEIGDIIYVHGQWGYQLDPKASYATWKLDQSKGGFSVMNDPGIHIIDLIYALFGMPHSVIAHGFKGTYKTSYTNVTALLDFADMTIAIQSSQTMYIADNDLHIYGTRGKIYVPQAFSQTYIEKMYVTNSTGERKISYEPTNLYENEMMDLLKIKTVGIPGTTLHEAIAEMKVLDGINKSIVSESTRKMSFFL